ncbi:hypothetical protein [Ferruginibacter sp. HRS2-29]|uniref:hypothetical protein n=1 Tax=Ferruginibacter sp. HRS2-29 TaxID=2487334 RepID=UPI0020CEC863|nr:hypothetical protein [Ferruginibacter sp. HRS2-29]MCP9750371.1 hypothetical protein [Ferruginibacter sp. HRS2-29]
MKLLFIFFISMSFSAAAQNSSLKLEVSKIHDTISQEKDLSISLKLFNNDKLPIIIPERYLIMSDDDSSDVSYEIVYVNNGKIEAVTQHKTKWSIDGFVDFGYTLLQPNHSSEISLNLDYVYFKRVGNYKVRATFHAAKFNRCGVGNVITEWVPFYVKNVNIVKQ